MIDLLLFPYQTAKLVKVLYFGYGIYPAARHDISYVKASVLIVFAAPAEGCHHRRGKADGDQWHQIGRIGIGPDQPFEYLMIPRQGIHHPPLECPSPFRTLIIIFRPALIAAELLIRPTVLYPVSTLQAQRHMPLKFLVTHVSSGFNCPWQISHKRKTSQKDKLRFFFFLAIFFLFLIIRWRLKFILSCKEFNCHI